MAAPKQMLKYITVDKNMPRQSSALACHPLLVDFARLGSSLRSIDAGPVAPLLHRWLYPLDFGFVYNGVHILVDWELPQQSSFGLRILLGIFVNMLILLAVTVWWP